MDWALIAANEVIFDLIEKGGNILYDHYIEEKLPDFAAAECMELMKNSVDLIFFKAQEAPLKNTSWDCEEEPERIKIDSWAVKAVPVRKPRPPVIAEILPNPRASTSSTYGRRKLGTGKRKPKTTLRTRKASNHEKSESQPILQMCAPLALNQSPSLEDLQLQSELGVTNPWADEIAKPTKVDKMSMSQTINRQQRIKDDREMLERRTQNLKGKKFTVDRNKLIIIRDLNPDALPTDDHDMDVKVDTARPSSAFSAGGRRRKSNRSSARSSRLIPPSARLGNTSIFSEVPQINTRPSFKPDGSKQPCLLDTVALAPGVKVSIDGKSPTRRTRTKTNSETNSPNNRSGTSPRPNSKRGKSALNPNSNDDSGGDNKNGNKKRNTNNNNNNSNNNSNNNQSPWKKPLGANVPIRSQSRKAKRAGSPNKSLTHSSSSHSLNGNSSNNNYNLNSNSSMANLPPSFSEDWGNNPTSFKPYTPTRPVAGDLGSRERLKINAMGRSKKLPRDRTKVASKLLQSPSMLLEGSIDLASPSQSSLKHSASRGRMKFGDHANEILMNQ
eukprot:TRINITY_DN32681_c0_g1_i1.p1 TRINITY_DN32681_c0_g1~~TRINITY_DN32681_c0_g1_i1.p1  ORF type:complete len:556 (-),score=151.25 TRINITY_DN32681_c0_g1_i1:118-1785(-)